MKRNVKIKQPDNTHNISTKEKLTLFISMLFGLLCLDFITKYWVFSATEAQITTGMNGGPVVKAKTIDIIHGFFDLQCVMNPGAFSGWFEGCYWFLIGVSIIALTVISLYLIFGKIKSKLFVLSLTFIAAGTTGNMYDRIAYGAVRDFLHFYIQTGNTRHSWPNFNVADMAICVGVGLWILLELFEKDKKKSPGAKKNPA